MEIVYFTIAALLLYVISDFILNTIEKRMGKRLPNRSMVFFVIIGVLAVSSFSVLEAIFKPLDPEIQAAVMAEKNVQPRVEETQSATTPAADVSLPAIPENDQGAKEASQLEDDPKARHETDN